MQHQQSPWEVLAHNNTLDFRIFRNYYLKQTFFVILGFPIVSGLLCFGGLFLGKKYTEENKPVYSVIIGFIVMYLIGVVSYLSIIFLMFVKKNIKETTAHIAGIKEEFVKHTQGVNKTNAALVYTEGIKPIKRFVNDKINFKMKLIKSIIIDYEEAQVTGSVSVFEKLLRDYQIKHDCIIKVNDVEKSIQLILETFYQAEKIRILYYLVKYNVTVRDGLLNYLRQLMANDNFGSRSSLSSLSSESIKSGHLEEI